MPSLPIKVIKPLGGNGPQGGKSKGSANEEFADNNKNPELAKKSIPEGISIPSRLIYTVNVPEIKDLQSKFIYNFYVPNECVVDNDILNDSTVSGMNISDFIKGKIRSEFTTTELSINRSKLPRYVKINFSPPSSTEIPYATSQESIVLSENNLSKIIKEENCYE